MQANVVQQRGATTCTNRCWLGTCGAHLSTEATCEHTQRSFRHRGLLKLVQGRNASKLVLSRAARRHITMQCIEPWPLVKGLAAALHWVFGWLLAAKNAADENALIHVFTSTAAG